MTSSNSHQPQGQFDSWVENYLWRNDPLRPTTSNEVIHSRRLEKERILDLRDIIKTLHKIKLARVVINRTTDKLRYHSTALAFAKKKGLRQPLNRHRMAMLTHMGLKRMYTLYWHKMSREAEVQRAAYADRFAVGDQDARTTTPVSGLHRAVLTAVSGTEKEVAELDLSAVFAREMRRRGVARAVAAREPPTPAHGRGGGREEEGYGAARARVVVARGSDRAMRGRAGISRVRAAVARGRAAEARGRNGATRGRPAETRGRAAEARGRAAEARGRAAEARRRDGATRERAAETRGRPAEPRGRAVEARGRAAEARRRDGAAREMAVEARGRAAEARGRPVEARGRAVEARGRAAEASGRPAEPRGRDGASQGRGRVAPGRDEAARGRVGVAPSRERAARRMAAATRTSTRLAARSAHAYNLRARTH